MTKLTEWLAGYAFPIIGNPGRPVSNAWNYLYAGRRSPVRTAHIPMRDWSGLPDRTAHIPVRADWVCGQECPRYGGRTIFAGVSAILRPLRCIRIRTGRVAPSPFRGPMRLRTSGSIASRTAHIPVRDETDARAGMSAVRGRTIFAGVSAILPPLRCIRIRTGRIAPSPFCGAGAASELLVVSRSRILLDRCRGGCYLGALIMPSRCLP